MIEIRNITKRYGAKTAVDNVSFIASPGRVTGFLGPNGAGKSTTLRILLGLDRADSGQALVGGRPYVTLKQPLRSLGAMLDGASSVAGRRGVDHLRWIAQSNRIPHQRIKEVLDVVGLTDAAKTRVGKYSLGMKQRLGLAAALLGKPSVLVLDEPVNGLDPEGIRFIRRFRRRYANEGNTVLLSSHLMSEVAETVDDVVIINKGRIVSTGSLNQITEGFNSLEDAFFALTDGENAGEW